MPGAARCANRPHAQPFARKALHAAGGLFMLTVHDWVSGRALRIRMLDTLLQRVRETPGAWIATVGEVAAHHAASANHAAFAVPLTPPESIATRRFDKPQRG